MTEATTIVASGVPDLYEALTRVIGFRIERSVIVAPFQGSRLSQPVVRLDFVNGDEEPEQFARIAHIFTEEGADHAFIFGVEDDEDESLETIRRISEALTIPVDRYVVRGGWINGLDCPKECCQDLPVTMALVGHEFDQVGAQPPMSGRDALRELIRPQQDQRPPAATPISIEGCAEAWAALLRGDFDEGEIPVTAVSDMLVSASIATVRDALAGRVLTQTLGPEILDDEALRAFAALSEIELPIRETSERLAKLCRACPDIAPTASILAITAHYEWCVMGNGALANIAVAEALRLDPDNTMARLLETLSGLGIRPPAVD